MKRKVTTITEEYDKDGKLTSKTTEVIEEEGGSTQGSKVIHDEQRIDMRLYPYRGPSIIYGILPTDPSLAKSYTVSNVAKTSRTSDSDEGYILSDYIGKQLSAGLRIRS